MQTDMLPIPAPDTFKLSGEKLYTGRLMCPAYQRTADIVNAGLSGLAEIPVCLDLRPPKTAAKPLIETGGGYTISISEGGIAVEAEGEAGVYAAFSSMAALARRDELGSYLPLGRVSARPKFGYRGSMLDVARHFHPMAEIRRLLDIMFRLRLNKFHWHIADDQGFRIALKKYPKLEEVASKRSCTYHGGFGHHYTGCDGKPHAGCYSEEEVRELIAYAADRGIEIIPELDIPGHASALIAAYPELACEGLPNIAVPGNFGVLENIICIGNDGTMRFVEGLLHELCDLFGAKTFHLGFDEVKLDHLRTCPKCRARMQALGLPDAEGLKAYAKDYFRDSLQKRGVTVILYNDGMDRADPGLICYHWLPGPDTTKRTTGWINAGQPAIIAPASHVYLDYPYAWTPFKKTYSFDPVLPGVERPENILGVEAPIWTEHIIDHGKLAFNAYYRLAALAETAWHGGSKRPYGEFMAELRAREEYYFGERLDIPEEVLNPGLIKRASLAKKCRRNMSLEYERFAGHRPGV